MKRVLMVAFHFPPLVGGSGIQRTLRFVQHLPSFGWQPLVVSAHPRAYENVGEDLMREIPEQVVVRRPFALDTARHLSIRRRYLRRMALPDRWVSWKFGAVREGMKLIERFRPEVLWTTYPIATAHLIGAALQERSGLPWVADFRDPMAQEGYPSDPAVWRSFKKVEERVFSAAKACVFTTPGAARDYAARYPASGARVEVIENGYDAESFGEPIQWEPLLPGAVTLLHSGVVYPSERDPTQFFEALGRLRDAGTITPATFRVRFRASGHEHWLRQLMERMGVAELVELYAPVPYREALAEMQRADALLVMQASNCNEQIPAKLYEYLRAGRPILGLTDPNGDTAGTLRASGIDAIVPLDHPERMCIAIEKLIGSLRDGTAARPAADYVAGASRVERSRSLAELFDRVARGV